MAAGDKLDLDTLTTAFLTRRLLEHGSCLNLRPQTQKIKTLAVSFPPRSSKLFHTGLLFCLNLLNILC